MGEPISGERRKKLLTKMKEIDRLDLWGLPECRRYWWGDVTSEGGQELTIDGCLEYLLKVRPEKPIYKRIILGRDPYDD
jgi:hypothetical protein